MAKIAAHRNSAGHQYVLRERQVAPMRVPRILPSPLPSPLSSRSPSPLHFGGDDIDAGVIEGLMHDAGAPPPLPRGPVRPRQGPDAVSEALRMHRRDRPAARMWSMDRDAQDSSESDGDSADDMQEADRVNLTATEHEDWWPFNSQMDLYGLGLFENPRHPLSVKTASIKDTLRRNFANLELRQNMLLYPRRGEIISTFQDAEHYHGLPGDVSGPCAILENGEVSFVTETVLLKDRRRVAVQAWYLDSKDNIRGTAREIATEQANEIDFALEEVEQRIGTDKHPLRQDNTPIFGVAVVIQCDDLSGVRYKKWNIHYAVSFQNAALQPDELRKESNIHLFAVRPHATPMEMIAAFIDQCSKAYATPVQVWDSLLMRMVRLRPFPLLILADNVMAATLCSHVGTGQMPSLADFAIGVGAGSTKGPKRVWQLWCRYMVYQSLQTLERAGKGVPMLNADIVFKSNPSSQQGTPRTSDETISALHKQVDMSTGVKDAMVEEITDILFETRRILAGCDKEERIE
ncbi:hypothetical protein V8E36_008572 [Tilletia maclaganii]